MPNISVRTQLFHFPCIQIRKWELKKAQRIIHVHWLMAKPGIDPRWLLWHTAQMDPPPHPTLWSHAVFWLVEVLVAETNSQFLPQESLFIWALSPAKGSCLVQVYDSSLGTAYIQWLTDARGNSKDQTFCLNSGGRAIPSWSAPPKIS